MQISRQCCHPPWNPFRKYRRFWRRKQRLAQSLQKNILRWANSWTGGNAVLFKLKKKPPALRKNALQPPALKGPPQHLKSHWNRPESKSISLKSLRKQALEKLAT